MEIDLSVESWEGRPDWEEKIHVEMARGGEYVAHVQPKNEQDEEMATMAMSSLFVINLVIQCYALSIDYEIDVFSTASQSSSTIHLKLPSASHRFAGIHTLSSLSSRHSVSLILLSIIDLS